jgi:hypothetical protein
MTTQLALLASSTMVVAAAMIQLGLRSRALSVRRVRRCASCGRRLSGRVCERCAER